MTNNTIVARHSTPNKYAQRERNIRRNVFRQIKGVWSQRTWINKSDIISPSSPIEYSTERRIYKLYKNV